MNDRWGNPYQIVIDTNYDNAVEVPDPKGGTMIVHTPVAVWS